MSNPNNKLDTALQTATGMQPIFVRMENQLFKKGGDYEAFCKTNENIPRSKVSQRVLSTLKSNANKDWEQIKSFVSEWEAKEQISDVQRFWIVNGFACDATADACKALASRPDVSFVYLQTGPNGLRQHRQRRRNSEPSEANKAAMQKGFAEQKDDSGKLFSTNGLEIPWDIKQIKADQAWEKEVSLVRERLLQSTMAGHSNTCPRIGALAQQKRLSMERTTTTTATLMTSLDGIRRANMGTSSGIRGSPRHFL
ncbi:MAG: hypothetical protein R2688_07805 [Fimbriimonadaceae bacterium]